MTYLAELDDRRQEVRTAASQTIVLWPKVRGEGNVTLDEEDDSASANVYRPNGVLIGAADVEIEDMGTEESPGPSRISITFGASGEDLLEGYYAIVEWTYAETTRIDTVRFDVVTEPWDGSDVSLNDLLEEVSDAGELLDGMAQLKGEDRTREQEASVVAVRAATDVKMWIRQQLEQQGRIFPRLIIDRESIRRVVTAQAIARIYRAQGGGPDSPARALAQDWTEEARRRLAELGTLDYDADEDRVADALVGGFAVVRVGRSWT